MKVDFSRKLSNLDGSIADDAPSLSEVVLKALLEDLRGDEVQSGKDKFDRALLAQRIHQSDGEADVTAEEVAMIKDRVGRAYPPLAVLRAWTILES